MQIMEAPLSKEEVAEFERLDSEIIRRINVVSEIYILAVRMRDGGLYRAKFKTWDEYCRARFHKTSASFRMLEYRQRVKEATKVLPETTETASTTAVAQPPPTTALSQVPPMPPSFRQEVSHLVAILDRLLVVDGSLAANQKFRQAVALARKIQTEVQGELPGMAAHFPKFTPPTLKEVQLFCSESDICPSDAHWFWNHMEGAGWKNNGEPVKKWQGTIIAWKLAKHLPSQKVFGANGHQVAKPKSIAMQDIERLQRQLDARPNL